MSKPRQNHSENDSRPDASPAVAETLTATGLGSRSGAVRALHITGPNGVQPTSAAPR